MNHQLPKVELFLSALHEQPFFMDENTPESQVAEAVGGRSSAGPNYYVYLAVKRLGRK